MKKTVYLILVVLLFVICGCTKNTSQLRIGTPLSFDGAEIEQQGGGMTLPPKTFAEVRKDYNLDQTIVFRGVVEGLRTPVEVYDKWEKKYLPEYCETKLRVLEAYYGDIQNGDLVTHYEWVKAYQNGDKVIIKTSDGKPPIEAGKEFIFILKKMDTTSTEGKPLYDAIAMNYYYNAIENYSVHKNAVQMEKATKREIFSYEVLDYYLNQPETKLDLRREALQYVDDIPENATQAEILQLLPEDKKELFDRMIKQYGVVTEN